MAEKEPTGLIVAVGVIVTGSTVIRDVHEGKTHAAPIVYGFMMVIALLLIGMGAPRVSRGLAYLSLIGALAVNGPAVFSIASGLSAAQKTAVAPKPAGGKK
jgi:hypothetical protein